MLMLIKLKVLTLTIDFNIKHRDKVSFLHKWIKKGHFKDKKMIKWNVHCYKIKKERFHKLFKIK